MSFFEKLFGSFSDKELKRINPLKDKVLALEPEMAKLTDEELQAGEVLIALHRDRAALPAEYQAEPALALAGGAVLLALAALWAWSRRTQRTGGAA